MAHPQPHFLTAEQIQDMFDSFQPDQLLNVIRIRYKNKEEIRRPEEMSVEALRDFVLECLENENQTGGDLEVYLPALEKTLVGHHDGIYWLKNLWC